MTVFVLYDRENKFVGASALEYDNEVDGLSILNDKIVEYDWETDQSCYNALNVLKDCILEYDDALNNLEVGLIYKYNGKKDSYSETLVKRNIINKGLDFDHGVITLNKSIANEWIKNADFLFEKGSADIEDVY